MIGLALSKEQFKTLMKVVYIANWVANGRRSEDEYLGEYEELEQYVFSRAKDAGFPDAAYKHKTNEKSEHYHPSRAFEFDRAIEQILRDYDEETFFDELADRFAARDMEEEYGKNAKEKLSPEEYADVFDALSAKYDEEIVENGIARLRWEID